MRIFVTSKCFWESPRSCSGVKQVSDISLYFKAENEVMKNIKYSDFQNPVLKRLLQDIIDPLHNYYGDIIATVINLHIVASKEEVNARALAKVDDQTNQKAEKLRKHEEKRAAKVANQLAQQEEKVLPATMSKADRRAYTLEKLMLSVQQVAINAGVINKI